ncbi:MAG: hypothetical protein IT385_00650 [Deltaproteobacteria bacterium]|nr:hypothetical protein [Deltaproteobacteria bacterium]
MRHARSSLLALTLLTLTIQGPQARAQEQDLLDMMAADLTALSVNLPVWFAQHVPAVMAPAGLGAGSGIDDDSGAFKIGLLTRLGLFNNFDDVGNGLQLVDLQPAMPSLMPWPQLGVVAGANLGDGFELGGDVQFIPELDIAAEDMTLKAFLLSVAVSARLRVNKADGAVPAFIVGLGGSYYTGRFAVGHGYSQPYSETIDGQTVEGTYSVDTAPAVEWSLFQLSPELRVAWDIGGVFRPYVGIGLGLTFGSISDRLDVRATATVERVNGVAQTQDPVVYDSRVVDFSTEPAFYALRPHLGFDVLLGMVAITLQLDLAVMGKDEIDSDLEGGASSFDPNDPNFLYNQNARESQTQAALVGTLALRLQF